MQADERKRAEPQRGEGRHQQRIGSELETLRHEVAFGRKVQAGPPDLDAVVDAGTDGAAIDPLHALSGRAQLGVALRIVRLPDEVTAAQIVEAVVYDVVTHAPQ